MQLKAGLRLKSTAGGGEFIVVRAPTDDVDLRCGGRPVVAMTEEAEIGPASPAFNTGTQMGKRYGGDDLGLELLCTKPGEGTLTVGDQPIPLKDAKLLPSSD